jgi:hypothetical protein
MTTRPFVAEVASTLNENLLLHHMLGKTQDKATRLFLLGNYLEGLRTTLFRQTLFAEFELKFHEMAEKGEPISGEKMSEMYLGLLRQYYGHSAGVCQVDFAVRRRVGLHPALLLTTSTSTSTPQHHRVGQPRRQHARRQDRQGARRLHEDAGVGIEQVSDRPAQGRRRRHDHVEAVQGRDGRDESRS